MPTEIDVLERQIMQLEMEKKALEKETDKAPQGAPGKVKEEQANLASSRPADGPVAE
jgi:ATP-dependent Clp protease ATP-binding subunit ClpB